MAKYNDLNIPQLKKELQKRGLATKGVKSKLQSRLRRAMEAKNINAEEYVFQSELEEETTKKQEKEVTQYSLEVEEACEPGSSQYEEQEACIPAQVSSQSEELSGRMSARVSSQSEEKEAYIPSQGDDSVQEDPELEDKYKCGYGSNTNTNSKVGYQCAALWGNSSTTNHSGNRSCNRYP
ncbi:pharyngeal muscle protein 2-like [Bactrocera oleae]|uniref:pharyngeal muscle protein 2-like n=1 Tax=Bactrocera oleae TaxID=104688 RepID=UPI00387E89C0